MRVEIENQGYIGIPWKKMFLLDIRSQKSSKMQDMDAQLQDSLKVHWEVEVICLVKYDFKLPF